MQQEEADAEATAAAAREERDKGEDRPSSMMSTPAIARAAANAARFTPFGSDPPKEDLTLTPIQGAAPISTSDRPLRCPFCVNQRMLRTIKEAVEHMSTHVVV
jgi:hypothetical protein